MSDLGDKYFGAHDLKPAVTWFAAPAKLFTILAHHVEDLRSVFRKRSSDQLDLQICGTVWSRQNEASMITPALSEAPDLDIPLGEGRVPASFRFRVGSRRRA